MLVPWKEDNWKLMHFHPVFLVVSFSYISMASSKHKSLCSEGHDILKESQFPAYCYSIHSLFDLCRYITNDFFKQIDGMHIIRIHIILSNILWMANIIFVWVLYNAWSSFLRNLSVGENHITQEPLPNGSWNLSFLYTLPYSLLHVL